MPLSHHLELPPLERAPSLLLPRSPVGGVRPFRRLQSSPMHKNRLEAFSDGVLAIIITIMVLELHAPHEPSMETLRPLVPALLSYVLSFIYVGIYWNNHHHLLQAA